MLFDANNYYYSLISNAYVQCPNRCVHKPGIISVTGSPREGSSTFTQTHHASCSASRAPSRQHTVPTTTSTRSDSEVSRVQKMPIGCFQRALNSYAPERSYTYRRYFVFRALRVRPNKNDDQETGWACDGFPTKDAARGPNKRMIGAALHHLRLPSLTTTTKKQENTQVIPRVIPDTSRVDRREFANQPPPTTGGKKGATRNVGSNPRIRSSSQRRP